MLAVADPVIESLVTRDGVRLDADVYRPRGGGPWPVLLMRQPYGRRIASTVCYAHPAWYAAHGYLVVIQDVRGRGTSEGEFDPFRDDGEDGAATIEWAATLSGASGNVGLYGFSYHGTNQLLAAARRPSGLRAIAPAMVGWNLPVDWAREGGAWALAANVEWAIQLATGNAARQGAAAQATTLRQAARALRFEDPVVGRPAVLESARTLTHYFDWLDTPVGDEYWRSRSPSESAAALARHRIPALFVGGWYDTHLRGTVAAREAMTAAGVTAPLIIGPWCHFPWGRRLGARDFGPAAVSDVDRRQIEWFDHWLKGAPAPARGWPAVRVFDVGTDAWRELAEWSNSFTSWHFASDGRAAIDEASGRLLRRPPEHALDDRLVHDPWRPCPTVGGPWGAPPGPVDRTLIDARPDVLTYTSEASAEPLTLLGSAEVDLDVRSDGHGFDLSVVLSVVDASGRATYLTEGYVSRSEPVDGVATVVLRPICATLSGGQRVRVSIAAASFPAFAVNPGDGTASTDAETARHRVVTLRVRHAGSRLRLPIAEDST